MSPPKIDDYLKDAKNLQTNSTSKFALQLQHEQNQEKLVQQKLESARWRLEKRRVETQQDRDLAFELRKINQQKTIDEKFRQQLRETNQELKALESKLRAAYVAKSLALQMAEKEVLLANEKRREKEENELMEAARIKHEEYERIQREFEAKKKVAMRRDLQNQMESIHKKKIRMYEHFLREKKILDEVIRKLYEEQLEEMRDKIAKKEQFREEMDKFLQAQKIWKERQKRETEEENKRLEEYVRLNEEKAKQELEKKKNEQQSRMDVSEQLGKQIKKTEDEKRQREELLIELHAAEVKEKEEARIRQELERQLRQRIMTRLQLDEQRESINNKMSPPKIDDYLKDAKNLQTNSTSKFALQLQHEQNQEKLVQQKLESARWRLEKRRVETQQDRDLAFELRKINQQKTIDEKFRQQLRETNQELKALESKLRAAYVAKSLALQMAEKEVLLANEKRREKEENELMEAARIKHEEYERIQREFEAKKKVAMRRDLQNQMESIHKKKIRMYEDFLREKKILDEVIRKLYEEQLEEMRDKIAKKEQFREEMDKFLQAQKIWKERQKRETEEENKRLEEYVRLNEEKAKQELEKKKNEQQSRMDVSEQLGKQIKKTEDEKRQREELLIELHAAEVKEKEEARIRQELERQLRQRIMTRLQLDEQRESINNKMSPPKIDDYLKDAKNLQTNSTSKFALQLQHEQNQEKLVQQKLESARWRLEKRRVETQQDRDLAFELRKINQQKTIDEKFRQQLRETNQELKALESKLRAAYVAKSLALQMAEKEVLLANEKRREKEENELMEAARIKHEEYERIQREFEAKKKVALRRDLQNQMESIHKKKIRMYEDFLREKKILDEVIRKLYEEQLEEMRDKIAKKEQFREEMDKFLQAQKIWKERQKRETEEENKRLEEYLRLNEEKAKQELEKKKSEQQSRMDVSEQLGKQIKKTEDEKRQREELLIELHAAEVKEKEEARIRQELERQLRQRIMTRLQLDEQRESIAQRRQREREEEVRFREEQLRLLAERDKIDQMSDEKRRRKVLEHRRAIQECLEEKKLRRAEDVASLVKQHEEEVNEEKRKQRLIEEERIRILQEHASALIGFLPPGILRESDREFLALSPRNPSS